MTLAKDLKKGDKITIDSENYTVESTEVSKVGKLGKAKCRIEALDKDYQKKIFIVMADEEIITQ
tara:strand:- start:9353 stop:9544 length:192 start_codon:yes stop_codon:yes gene_type:complete